jgi:hypothetical protein
MGTRSSLQPTTSESQAFVLRLYWFFTKFYGELVAECSESCEVQQLVVLPSVQSEDSISLTIREIVLLL